MKLLANLCAFAEENNLCSPFQSRAVTVRLCLDKKGYAGMSVVRPEEKFVPPLLVRSGIMCLPMHMYDDPEFVLGLVQPGKEARVTPTEESAFSIFWRTTEETLVAAGDQEALQAVRAARKDSTWAQRAKGCIPGDDPCPKIALSYGGQFLVDRPLVRAYFEAILLSRMQDTDTGPDVCLVTGKRCVAVQIHDYIRNVPGCGMAAPFISFGDRSTTQERFKLKDGKNFPMSTPTMLRYTSALNHLLETSAAKVSKDSCYVFWGPKQASSFAKVVGPPVRATREEYRAFWQETDAAWRGVEEMLESDEDLHILCLKGSKGRIAVLSYDLRPAREVAQSVLRFRHHYGDRNGSYAAGVIYQAMADLLSRKDEIILSNSQKVGVVRSLLLGGSLPPLASRSIFRALSPKSIVEGKKHANAQINWAVLNERLVQNM